MKGKADDTKHAQSRPAEEGSRHLESASKKENLQVPVPTEKEQKAVEEARGPHT